MGWLFASSFAEGSHNSMHRNSQVNVLTVLQRYVRLSGPLIGIVFCFNQEQAMNLQIKSTTQKKMTIFCNHILPVDDIIYQNVFEILTCDDFSEVLVMFYTIFTCCICTSCIMLIFALKHPLGHMLGSPRRSMKLVQLHRCQHVVKLKK